MTTKRTPRPPAAASPHEGDAAAVFVKLSTLRPWKRNPRVNAQAVDKVKASIERFGFGAPIVAQEGTNRIVAGHTRHKAAQALGLDVVPVRFLRLSDDEAATLALADNRLGEIAEWDLPGLSDVLKGLPEELRALAGWDEHELTPLLAAEWDAVAGTDGRLPNRNAGPYRIELEPADARAFERALARHRKGKPKATAGELVGAWARAALARS